MSNPPNEQSYVTVSQPGDTSHNYHDRDSLPFDVKYPLVNFTDEWIHTDEDAPLLRRQLLGNYWYQKSNMYEREEIQQRLVHINKYLRIVTDFIERKYLVLGFTIEHISLAGSYLHAHQPGDIDFDVILRGSYFDYVTFNEGVELLDTTGSVKKISLTVMGMDNVLGKRFTVDDIRNKGFVHHDTIIREMLVAPMRNVTVFGKPFDENKNIDSRNVLVRVARQLYFADLTIQGKIPYYEEDPLRSIKAAKRVKEAYEIIDWLLLTSSELRSNK